MPSHRDRAFVAPRRGFLLAWDACATICAFHLALVLSGDPGGALAEATAPVTALLVIVRVASLAASRLHRWDFRRAGTLDALALAAAMLAASLVFALVHRELPVAVYALEFFLSTSLMSAVRLAPGALEEFFRRRFPGPKASFMTLEWPRRTLNVLVALAGLVLSLPLWIAIAAAIKLTSRGPVFYVQERVGLDLRTTSRLERDPRRRHDLGGRPFMMYKFRTMRVDAESGTGAVWSGKGDPRVTSVGRFLRYCRLDELPQLLNVLKGDMNVVGPRPERPALFAELRTRIPHYAQRQRVRPGITGAAQVKLDADATVEDVARKVRYDLEYLSKQSVRGDLSIMAKTIPVMLLRDRLLEPSGGRPEPSPLARGLWRRRA